eukprot:669428-Heterocapsa_arctica.AAC.1
MGLRYKSRPMFPALPLILVRPELPRIWGHLANWSRALDCCSVRDVRRRRRHRELRPLLQY